MVQRIGLLTGSCRNSDAIRSIRERAVVMSANVKGFGCRPNERGCRGLRGPASESLQGRKPREWVRVWCGARYGDLGAARTAGDGRRCDAASWRTVKQLASGRRAAVNGAGAGAI